MYILYNYMVDMFCHCNVIINDPVALYFHSRNITNIV